MSSETLTVETVIAFLRESSKWHETKWPTLHVEACRHCDEIRAEIERLAAEGDRVEDCESCRLAHRFRDFLIRQHDVGSAYILCPDCGHLRGASISRGLRSCLCGPGHYNRAWMEALMEEEGAGSEGGRR